MDKNKEFDELARQKLAERAFPFEEAHWQQAQELIAAQKRDRGGAYWITGGVALLLLLSVSWWMLKDQDGPSTDVAAVAAARTEAGTIGSDPSQIADLNVERTDTFDTNDHDAKNTLAPAERDATIPREQATGSATSRETRPAAIAGTNPSTRASRKAAAAVPAAEIRTGSAMQNANKAAATPGQQASDLPGAAQAPAPTPSSDATNTPNIPNTGSAVNAATIPTSEVANSASATAEGDAPAPTGTDRSHQIPTDDAGQVNANSTAEVPDQFLPSTAGPGVVPAVAGEVAGPIDAGPVTPPTIAQHTAENIVPSDSATATPQLPVVPPIIPDRAPWEISVLGGLLSSTSVYSGANSDTWNNSIGREMVSGMGIELMHMGRNIGLGMGLHYGSYAERLSFEAVDLTTIDRFNYWALFPVDTTLLFITDTITQNGQTYYLGQSITTTINVLGEVSDSTVTTMRLREARQVINRTSYVEVPILFDAHLVQGRWSLGLRGGPTVGLLTGRQGALPSEDGITYTDLADRAFRQVMFGYTARAYIRYRWNAAWSIGVEPTVRGQLQNSLGDGPLDRRSSAFGGMISVSYRLR